MDERELLERMQKRIKLLEIKSRIFNVAIIILSIGLILLRLKFL